MMQNISMIVAMDNNRGIGRNNELLWHLPNDLKHFKKITMGKPIIMGRKTYESIGRPLPGRENIVITSNSLWQPVIKGCKNTNTSLKIFTNIETLTEYLATRNYSETIVIGGGEIYKLFMNVATKIYLTLVDVELNADVFFPELDNSWIKISEQLHVKDTGHQYNFKFIELSKK